MKRERNRWNKIGLAACLTSCLALLCACDGRGDAGHGKSAGETDVSIASSAENEKNAADPGETLRITALEEAMVPENADEDDRAGAMQRACGSAMVTVRAGKLMGSGVIYDSDESTVWIATAAHVLEYVTGENDEVSVTFEDGFTVVTTEKIFAKGQDLALLVLPREALLDEAQDGVASAEGAALQDHGQAYRRVLVSLEAYDRLAAGDTVIAMGSKSGVGEDASVGTLLKDYVYSEDFGSYVMLADLTVSPGMSGGALFDAQGHLMGILCGVSEDGEVAAAPLLGLLAMR